MLNVNFCVLPAGKIVGIYISGHCGFAFHGKDIVCAAVSSAVYLVVNTITDILKINAKRLFIEDGKLEFIINESDEPQAKALFDGLKAHLKGLEEMYPKNIRINYMEV
jgi:Predicted ribosomal protein